MLNPKNPFPELGAKEGCDDFAIAKDDFAIAKDDFAIAKDDFEFAKDDFVLATEGFERFKETIEASRQGAARRKAFLVIERIAAVLLVPVVLFSLYLLSKKNSPVEWNEVYTLAAQTSIVTLPDGSTLRLAPQSRLIYPSEFTGDKRKVFLYGEAYANITHDEEHPFEIYSDEIKVTVLGTEFNFSSYAEDSESELALVDGSVEMRIDTRSDSHTFQMKTGDVIHYNRNSGSIDRQRFSIDPYLSNVLKEGIQLNNRRMEDIVKLLERKFDTSIIIEDQALKDERFYASFINGEDLSTILNTLNTQNHMKISRDGDTIRISLK